MEIPEDIRNLTFEEARNQLEELVRRMESGNLPLEQLINAYERGAFLASHCRDLLAGLQRQHSQRDIRQRSVFPDTVVNVNTSDPPGNIDADAAVVFYRLQRFIGSSRTRSSR